MNEVTKCSVHGWAAILQPCPFCEVVSFRAENERLKAGPDWADSIGDAETIQRLEREIIALKLDKAELRAALSQVEWVGIAPRIGEEWGTRCPSCGGTKDMGHLDSCRTAAALEVGDATTR